MKKEELKNIAGGRPLASSDKRELLRWAASLGIAHNLNPACPNCWADLAIIIYNSTKDEDSNNADN